MNTKGLIFSAACALMFFATSCELFDELKDDNDIEKVVGRIANEWVVDSARVINYGFNPDLPPAQQPVESDTLLPITKMKFVWDKNTPGYGGQVFETSRVNGVETMKEYRWLYTEYLVLYFPNPGTNDVEIIYDIAEISDSKFHFFRNEDLISETTGGKDGSRKQIRKMHR
jgi:hypothetical protein